MVIPTKNVDKLLDPGKQTVTERSTNRLGTSAKTSLTVIHRPVGHLTLTLTKEFPEFVCSEHQRGQPISPLPLTPVGKFLYIRAVQRLFANANAFQPKLNTLVISIPGSVAAWLVYGCLTRKPRVWQSFGVEEKGVGGPRYMPARNNDASALGRDVDVGNGRYPGLFGTRASSEGFRSV
jgi:hypothetical protein